MLANHAKPATISTGPMRFTRRALTSHDRASMGRADRARGGTPNTPICTVAGLPELDPAAAPNGGSSAQGDRDARHRA